MDWGRLDPNSDQPLALGFSGGGDSLALMLMARDWAAAHGRRLLVLTVDHGLHPQSAQWTQAAAAAARDAGLAWRGLRWIGAKPLTGLPAAARAARHALLAEAARQAGARVLLLGHTLDDLEEGERMRQRDAPSLGRLRPWGPSPVWPEGRGVFLLRPMLGLRREALREWLRGQGLSWHEDPANQDRRFARTRARLAISSPAEGIDQPQPSAPPNEGQAWSVTPDGRILAPRSATTRFLSAALLCAGGGQVPPRGERLARLKERLEGRGPVAASLAGARIEADGDLVVIGREAGERARGGLAGSALAAGEPIVWDGRYLVTAAVEDLRVEPLAGRMGDLSRNDRLRLKAFPPSARSALPVLVGALRAALPQPFGDGPGSAVSLVQDRLAGALGLIRDETQLRG